MESGVASCPDPANAGSACCALAEARALCEAERWDEAAALCRAALARDVTDGAALYLLGVVLLKQGNAAEAVPVLAAVAEQAHDPAVLYALGEGLQALGLTAEAEARWRSAAALPNPPAELWLALGNMSLARDDLAGAEHYFRTAIAARPDFVEALHNLGNALVARGRLEEAYRCYATAVALRPGGAGTRYAYALALLLGGQYAEGWRYFEARRDVPQLRWNYQRRPALPQWQPGVGLDGQRVLLLAEQGFGDVIQFVRYAPLLAARGAAVTLELPETLAGVFAGLPGLHGIITPEAEPPACDLACPLLSLPLYFGTTLETVPCDVPYAAVPPEKVAPWQAWLGPASGRLRIGLVCSGRPEHPNDRSRSLPLAAFAPILATPRCDFVLLQAEIRVSDQAVLAATPAVRWPALRDFGDTAALLASLDVLISVDTAVAHLAGALGRPVWLMLPHAPDFRWLLGRDDSPWYPATRLYRQPSPGDWDTVLAAVRRDLGTLG